MVDGRVEQNGRLDVSSTIALQGRPERLEQRFATTLDSGRDQRYHFAISEVKATVGGQSVTPDVRTDGDYTVVSVPLAGTTGDVQMAYAVDGAALKNADGTTTLNWRLLQGLNLPVARFDAQLKVPGHFTAIDCYAGAPDAPAPCGYYGGGTHDEPDPVFHQDGLGQGQVVGAVLRFPGAVVASNQQLTRLWTLDHAFSLAPLPLAAALATALLGGLLGWAVHRRFGRDAAGGATPSLVGRFVPVGARESAFELSGDIRPAEVGTLMDESVDPIDVTASVIDLAVRGHLVIEQLPRAGEFKATDWALARRGSEAALRPYERHLMDALAPVSGPARPLSDVAAALHAALPTIQSEMYDEVVNRGWFVARPDVVRRRWTRIGWVAVVLALIAAALLVAFTSFGLLALVLVGLAAGVGVLGQAMPARTASGSAALAGLGVLRGALLTQPVDQMPRGREHEELSQVLPYAVVLGGADRWLDGLAAVDDPELDDRDELGWYRGPEGWKLSDLPDSLRSFLRAFAGLLVSR